MVGSTKKCIQFFNMYAGAQLKPVFGGFETRLKFFKFGHFFITHKSKLIRLGQLYIVTML